MLTYYHGIPITPGYYPAGRVPGCKPRRSKVGEICPTLRDTFKKVIPRDQWSKYIGKVPSIKDYIKVIFDQNGVGSCATEAANQATQTTGVIAGRKFVQLNPWFMYHTTSGGSDSGSNIDDNLKFARDTGCCPESVWPRSKGWRAKPSAEAYEAAKANRILEFYDITTSEEFATACFMGWPVVWGYSGHSIMAVEVLSTTKIKYANSWGSWTDCGDPGYGTASFSSIVWGYGAWAVRTTTDPVPDDPLAYLNDVVIPRRVAEQEKLLAFEPYPVFENVV